MRRIIHSVIPPGNDYQAGYRIKIRLIYGLTKDQALISIFTIQEFPSQDALHSVIIGFMILTLKHHPTTKLNLNLEHNSYHSIHLSFIVKLNIAEHSSVFRPYFNFLNNVFLVF